MKIVFVLVLLSASFSYANQISTGKIILVKTSTSCGSQKTYSIEDEAIGIRKINQLKWVLNYILTEPPIDEFDFTENTGTYLNADKVDGYLKEESLIYSKTYPGELERSLTEMRALKINLKRLRDKSVKKINSKDQIKDIIKKYLDVQSKIIKILTAQFGIKVTESGEVCRSYY